MKILKSIALLVVVTILFGCGGTRMMVIKAPEVSLAKYKVIAVPPLKNNVGAPAELASGIREEVIRELQRIDGRVTPSTTGNEKDTVLINISIVNWDTGSMAGRWLTGGVMGEGTATAMISIVDASTLQTLGQANVEGTVKGGFFGGSMKVAGDKLVKGIIQFVRSHI